MIPIEGGEYVRRRNSYCNQSTAQHLVIAAGHQVQIQLREDPHGTNKHIGWAAKAITNSRFILIPSFD
jgi:hypothetical protein